MPPKRNRALDEQNVPSKVWKTNPPGPEQKELNRLFDKGLVDHSDTPAKVRSRYPMFSAFPSKTFALYFRTTKAKYGLNAVGKAHTGNIPELGGSDDVVEEPEPPSSSPTECIESHLEVKNYPHMVWTYTDHENQKDMVCVAIPTVTGSRDVRFTISEDGLQLFVDFVWPDPLFVPNDLFLDVVEDADGTAISMSHPKIYAYRSYLADCGFSEKSKPKASLIVNLPLKVQRELGTYDTQGVTCGETKVAMLEFTAYQKKAVIRDADNLIKF